MDKTERGRLGNLECSLNQDQEVDQEIEVYHQDIKKELELMIRGPHYWKGRERDKGSR